MDADVLIIGAGPSGSLAGCMLRKLGHRVVILEKAQFPRFSIGESLLPQCMTFMEQAGVLGNVEAEGFQLKNGAAFSHDGKLTEFDFSDKFTPGWSTTYQVPRAHFDRVLADAAEAAGVSIHYQHRILSANFNQPGQARLTTEDAKGARKDWIAPFVLDASGFGRVLPRLLDLEVPSPLRPRQALGTHVQDHIGNVDYDRNKVLIAIHPQHHEIWYWLIPFSNGRSSVGVVVPQGFLDTRQGDPINNLRGLLMEEPRLKSLLGEAHFDTPVQTVNGYSANVRQLYGEGFVLLGNAGEFLDPVFSSGITIAMKSVALAVPLVDRQLRGGTVDWMGEFEQPLRRGIEVFRAYVDAWYDGSFHRVLFDRRQLASIKAMICSVLAGYAWDESNPFAQRRCGKRLLAVAELCSPL
jgi:flavin-dependent dehydrogenase